MPADRIAELEAFLAVAQAGSLSAAARRLGLTPSSVSRIVARTEARLGVRLLLRTTRRLQLTAEGEVYLRAAGRILADLDETEGGIADQAAPRGLLRVSAALAYGRMVVVPLLGEFLRRYPEIKLDIELSDRIVDIAGGRADVAIRFGPLPDSGLLARKLDETGRTVVAAPDYLRRAGTPLRPADLQSHSCLDFSFRRVQAGWPFREDGQDRFSASRGVWSPTTATRWCSSRGRGWASRAWAPLRSRPTSLPGGWCPCWKPSTPVTRKRSTPCSSAARSCLPGFECSWISWPDRSGQARHHEPRMALRRMT